MKKRNVTKRALFLSFVSMFMCFTMLLGTTYAWFTDTVTSGVNQIVAGNLDVELYKGIDDTAPAVTDQTKLFQLSANQLWEPGAVVYENLTVANEGNLALKYQLSVKVSNATATPAGKTLADVLKIAVVEDDDGFNGDREAAKALTNYRSFADFEINGSLKAGDADKTYGLVIYWAPGANDNDYNMNKGENALTIDIGVELFATQLEAENDSFGNDYDNGAIISGSGFAPVPADGVSAVELAVRDKNNAKVATAIVPAEAIATGVETLQFNVEESDYEGNFTVAAGSETVVYDVTVEGLKDGNTVLVKVALRLPAGLDPATVKLYHYDTEIPNIVYDPNTGYVTFETATFSPFTIVYDAESEYEAPSTEGVTYPKATVTQYDLNLTPGYAENVSWETYGGWSPDYTVDADPKLEAAFMFKCPENLDADVRAAYENWYCDFFVSLDKDLGENEIFLGGNYGDFGWVGFHNGTLTLPANTEIALLSSVTTNPWTYAQVEQWVGEFICGVGDVDDALTLKGATFTVKLRLINPATVDTSNPEWWADLSEAEYYDVNTVTYTFGGNYTIQ